MAKADILALAFQPYSNGLGWNLVALLSILTSKGVVLFYLTGHESTAQSPLETAVIKVW